VAAVVSAFILGKSKRPLGGAWTFTAGAASLDVLFAIVILASGAFESGGDAGAIVDVVLGAVFGALGVVAIFSTESPEKEEAQRARVERVASGKLRTLFTAGLLVQVINFDAIAVFGGALNEIAEAGVTTGQEIVATLFGLAHMLSVYYAPALIYALSPARAAKLLEGMTEWILRNSRMIEIVVGLAFGVLFLSKGLSALL
jgi:threonine/homoserine/homoserine lactone efflux protein